MPVSEKDVETARMVAPSRPGPAMDEARVVAGTTAGVLDMVIKGVMELPYQPILAVAQGIHTGVVGLKTFAAGREFPVVQGLISRAGDPEDGPSIIPLPEIGGHGQPFGKESGVAHAIGHLRWAYRAPSYPSSKEAVVHRPIPGEADASAPGVIRASLPRSRQGVGWAEVDAWARSPDGPIDKVRVRSDGEINAVIGVRQLHERENRGVGGIPSENHAGRQSRMN